MTEPSEAQVKYLEAFIICKMLQWHGGFEFRFLQRLSAPHLKRQQRWEPLNLAVARLKGFLSTRFRHQGV